MKPKFKYPGLAEMLQAIDVAELKKMDVGICYGMPKEMREAFLEDIKAWPKHSRIDEYPVPHPHTDPRSAYLGAKHLWEGEYGETRAELLSWCREVEIVHVVPVDPPKPVKRWAIPKM